MPSPRQRRQTMRVLHDLITYLDRQGQLSEADLLALHEQGLLPEELAYRVGTPYRLGLWTPEDFAVPGFDDFNGYGYCGSCWRELDRREAWCHTCEHCQNEHCLEQRNPAAWR